MNIIDILKLPLFNTVFSNSIWPRESIAVEKFLWTT